jgi:16S rRNA (cytosine967-C5)-methyltransferase
LLLDVPCSGTGAIRRNPESRWRLGERDLAELRAKQREILERYAGLVAPGGRLIYATCSLLDEENDAVVRAFLADHPAFEPVLAKEILGRERALRIGDGEVLRLLPQTDGTDGFFARVLRRTR